MISYTKKYIFLRWIELKRKRGDNIFIIFRVTFPLKNTIIRYAKKYNLYTTKFNNNKH